MYCPECKGTWEQEELREPRFRVCYGALRVCQKCGRAEYADYTGSPSAGDWRPVKLDVERKKAMEGGHTCPFCVHGEKGPCDRFEACRRAAFRWFEKREKEVCHAQEG